MESSLVMTHILNWKQCICSLGKGIRLGTNEAHELHSSLRIAPAASLIQQASEQLPRAKSRDSKSNSHHTITYYANYKNSNIIIVSIITYNHILHTYLIFYFWTLDALPIKEPSMEVSVLNLGSVILLLHAFSSSWDFTNRRLSILMLDFLLPMMLSQTNPNCNLGTLNGKRQLYVLPTIGIPIQSITIPGPSRDWEGFVENRCQIAWLFEHSTTGLKTSQKPCCNRMPWPEMHLSSGQIVHDDISREDTGCRDRKLILQFSACESFQQNAPVQNVPMHKNV